MDDMLTFPVPLITPVRLNLLAEEAAVRRVRSPFSVPVPLKVTPSVPIEPKVKVPVLPAATTQSLAVVTPAFAMRLAEPTPSAPRVMTLAALPKAELVVKAVNPDLTFTLPVKILAPAKRMVPTPVDVLFRTLLIVILPVPAIADEIEIAPPFERVVVLFAAVLLISRLSARVRVPLEMRIKFDAEAIGEVLALRIVAVPEPEPS